MTENSSASDSSTLSRHEAQQELFRRLSTQALMTNARFWLSQFSPEPFPDEAEVPFASLIANGALLSRVGAALQKATQQGVVTVPPVALRAGEAWEAPAGAARAGRVADDAAAFVAACRALGVRSVECCSALDITHPGAASTKAVCVSLYALSLRCKALGLRVAPFPVNDLSFPSEDTRERTAAFDRKSSAESMSPRSGAGSVTPSPRAAAPEPDAPSSATSAIPAADAAAYVPPSALPLPSLETGPVLPPGIGGSGDSEGEEEVCSGLLLPPPAAPASKPQAAAASAAREARPPALPAPRQARDGAAQGPSLSTLAKAAAGGAAALLLLLMRGRRALSTGAPFGDGTLIVWRAVSARDVRARVR